MITVHRTGPLATIQDLGRPGYAELGVSPSGAADRGALRVANRLVGNPEGAAAIEMTLGGLEISTDDPLWCAVTGPSTTARIDQRPIGSHHSVHLEPGDRLVIGVPPTGLRNYLAIRGGLDTPELLGSRSADLLSGLGPARLQPGDRIPVGTPVLDLPDAELAVAEPPTDAPTELIILPGPRADWFTATARDRLSTQVWTVGDDSDRTAIRLDGEPLERSTDVELPSEAVIRGAVQVPTSGLPLIFGADHPVTGGYPVIAVVIEPDCDRAAQLRPGDPLRFREAPNHWDRRSD